MAVIPLGFIVSALAKKSAYSILFEVLPVWLLTLQSLVAISTHGDVDGRSRTPLLTRGPIGAIRNRVGMGAKNSKLAEFIGKWTITERHNMDEFLEGALSPPPRHLIAARVHR